ALEYVLYHVCRALVPAPGVGVRQGTLVAKSVVSRLSHDLIEFFLPVAVPTAADVSDSDHLRPLLHMAQSSGGQQQQKQKRAVSVDLLDVCEHGQAVDVAQYFVFCAGLAWLPAGADPAQWDTKMGHVVGLSLMQAAMEYMAKGEQQAEQAKARGKGGARVEMNGSVRSVVRRQMEGPLSDTLALVVESGKRGGVAEASEMWLVYFVQAVRTWARYAMPWHGTNTSSTTSSSSSSEAPSAGLSEAWQQRMRVVVWGVGAAMYAPVLEDITRLLAAPHMNLLARAPRSAIDDASALDPLRGADALRAVECIASAFAEPELRAILVAVDSVWGHHGHAGAVLPSSSSSPRFNALVADATRLLSSATSAETLPPPQVADSSVFVSPHSALFRDLVVALQRADVLCDRQLRLLDAAPSLSTSDRAQAAATHVLDVVARAFSASASAEPLSTAESAR
ncbi:hypothetical protein GGI24_006140, partial [Coemansia furcata]